MDTQRGSHNSGYQRFSNKCRCHRSRRLTRWIRCVWVVSRQHPFPAHKQPLGGLASAVFSADAFLLIFYISFFIFSLPTIVLVLSDLQAQQLKGGNPGAFQANRLGRRINGGFGLFMRSSRTAFQPIVNTVNQVNFAINIAVNGGSIINTQINSLAIDTSL